ncbi:MAG: polysaccharide deacetylase family protein [Clostridiales bacterium]|nr:polysaccharide deacetylase family protein [Clostridiales bacterium]
MIKFDRYTGGKQGAVTFSYDDGCRQDRRLVELFNKYGAKCTFNVFSAQLESGGEDGKITKDELKTLYAGHELACHAYHHPHLERMIISAQYAEIIEDRKTIESAWGKIVRGMAFTYGTWNGDTLTAMKTAGIEYSRTTNSTGGFLVPDDFATWNPTCHHNESEKPINQFIYNLEKAPWRAGGLLYIWGHSYEFDFPEAPVGWDEFEKRVAALAAHSDNIWFCTNSELKDYVEAQRALRSSADGRTFYNPTQTDVWVSNDGVPVCIGAGKTVTL